jgi:hypothetical protein
VQQVQVVPGPKPGQVSVNVVPAGTPQSKDEFRALEEKRSDLSDQLVSAQNRRNNLANQLKTADPSARPGIEARLKVLDDRLVFLEQELAVTGQQISNTPMAVRAQTQVPDRIRDKIADEIVPVTAILSVFVLAPLALAVMRLIWRRASEPRPAIDGDANRKLEHLIQAVDTIAIEVERISESQRYLTKVVNERQPDQIPRSASRSN